MSVSIDTNYDPSERWDGGVEAALARADVVLPNEAELLALTRCTALEGAMQKMQKLGRTLAVKLGERGAIAQRGDEIVQASGVPVEVADTVGAGDSFDAGFIYGHLAGWELARALRLACVCGSLSARGAGGTAAQATFEEASQYL